MAYFDGTESGRLISLLTNDLDLMMSPIQSSLSSLLNNILILIGGMAMYFIHSYRLSMLALVTTGPISYLWGLYVEWSKGLAREMLLVLLVVPQARNPCGNLNLTLMPIKD